MMLTDKVAVVYGAAGAIGSAVARAFAREGGRLFLTGRLLAPVVAVAQDIVSAGGTAEAAEVDALDEAGISQHLDSVLDMAGRIDISFNAVGVPDKNIVGVPLVELDVEQFSMPIMAYATSYFLTARLAARQMIPNKSGVIMTVTAVPSRTGTPLNGGYGPAQAAKEALTRELSAELAPQGIRVVGLRPYGIPEAPSLKEVFVAKTQRIGHDVGTVARVDRRQEPRATAYVARRDRQRCGLRGFGSGERDDGNDGEPEHGQPGRLAATGLGLRAGWSSKTDRPLAASSGGS